MNRLSLRLFALAALCAFPARVHSQLPPLTVPKGLLRFSIAGTFDNYDERFRNGVLEPSASDFVRDSLGSNFFPGLSVAEGQLRRITGVAALKLNLGQSTSSSLINVGTAHLGLAYGLTRHLTLFGNVPIVRVRVQSLFSLNNKKSNLGFNPADAAFGTPGVAAQFLTELRTATTALQSRVTSGDFDTDPNKKATAQRAVSDAQALDSLVALSPLLPLIGSDIGQALNQAITGLGSTFSNLLVSGFPAAAPPFPTKALNDTTFLTFISNPKGPIQGLPWPEPIISGLGDMELGAMYEWLDHPVTATRRVGLHSVIQAIVRLRTGILASPSRFFAVNLGDRQPDVEVNLVTDASYRRIGVRLQAGYNLQLPGNQERRISNPTQPIPYITALAALTRDPGDVIQVQVLPFFHLAPMLALFGGVQYWMKGIDKYAYVAGQPPIPGLDPNFLSVDSKSNATVFSMGMSYAHTGIGHDGQVRNPLDASLAYEQVQASSAGRVPASRVVRFSLRLYTKIR